MSESKHLTALERKHQQLDQALAEAALSPAPDAVKVAEMKRKKLQIKDAMIKSRAILAATLPNKSLASN